MRKLIFLLVGTAILCVPALSLAATPTPAHLATQTCRQIRAQDGRTTFRQAYHSFAGCLKQQKPNSTQDISNAAKTCQVKLGFLPASKSAVEKKTTADPFSLIAGAQLVSALPP